MNGQLPFATGYELDGTDNQDPIHGVAVINPNLDAVSEMKVTSQNYDAEFGAASRWNGDGSDEVRYKRIPRLRFRIPPFRCATGARSIHRSSARSTDRKIHQPQRAKHVRWLDRRAS